MKKVLLVTNLLVVAILMSGCASIVTGKYQDISVTSDPPGAKVIADNGMIIITPGSFKLERNHNYTLIAQYPGTRPQQKDIKHGVQGWFWGNILLVSGAGCALDLTSGSAYKLIPDKVNFDFTNAGVAVLNHKHSYLETDIDATDRISLKGLNDP